MAKRFSDEFLSELRSRCDIEQIISSYVPLKRRGKNLVGLCPFHNEKTPSFTVYPDSQSFYCFGCGAAGEVISFVKKIENLDFYEAVRSLCDRAGMSLPVDGYDSSIAEKRRRTYEINKEAARFFHSCLFSEEGREGLEYFKARGMKKSTITRFGLGFAPNKWDGLLRHMREKGYYYEELYEANLANKSEKNGSTRFYDSFRNRVIVPIIDVRGNVVAFGGRVLDDSKPKYINSSDTLVYKKSLGVFGLNFAKNAGEKSLILVEGYMDAISLHQAGFTNAIACLGTALTGEMAHLLARYAEEIILCYDADEAGQKATARALGVFNSIGMKTRVIRLSGGKDPDEILRKYGPERFRSLIDESANDIEFALLRARKDLDLSTSDGKMKYLDLAAEVLAATDNKIAQDIYSSRLSQELGVDKQAILARIEQIRRKKKYTQQKNYFRDLQKNSMAENTKTAMQNSTNIRTVKAEELLIACLMKNPDFYRHIEDAVSAEDFTVEDNRAIFAAVAEKITACAGLDFTLFTQDLTDAQLSRLIGICEKNGGLPMTLKTCTDCIDVIRGSREGAAGRVSADKLSDEEFLNLFRKKQ
ncbi:MAG: DNA primase [Oscillospiraceae bacterium]|nr:DNA primase [Oscillospiraceae bacterium]